MTCLYGDIGHINDYGFTKGCHRGCCKCNGQSQYFCPQCIIEHSCSYFALGYSSLCVWKISQFGNALVCRQQTLFFSLFFLAFQLGVSSMTFFALNSGNIYSSIMMSRLIQLPVRADLFNWAHIKIRIDSVSAKINKYINKLQIQRLQF